MLTEKEIIDNVTEKCERIGDVEFLGICEFKGVKTKLKLRCKKDLTYWDSTTYYSFIKRNNLCPFCVASLKFTEEKLIKNVTEQCKLRNYEFLGIVDEFKGVNTKLKLRCKRDNYYWESTNYICFINKNYGCSFCSSKLKLTEESLVENVKKECLVRNYEFLGIVGEFKGNKTKLKLRCIKHNYNWESTDYSHFMCKTSKRGCAICGKERTIASYGLTKEVIIKNVKEECQKRNYIFLDLCEFNGCNTKLKLHCVEHNYNWEKTRYVEFTGKKKFGCPICGKEKSRAGHSLTKIELIENVKKECERRGDNIEFLGIVGEFNGAMSYLKLHCIKDDYIWETSVYNSFVGKAKNGCPLCAGNLKIDKSIMIENIEKECKERNYEFLGFVNEFKATETKLKLRCIKDDFIWETTKYIKFVGIRKQGCPKCNSSKLEQKIEKLLKENNIKFIPQYSFSELKNGFGKQTLDFYLPDYNIAIECQGNQHFIPVKHFGGELKYEYILESDERKYNICKDKGIRILYYTECRTNIIPDTYHDEIFTDEFDLLAEIFENNQ